MITEIQKELAKLEQQQGIKILYAIETGSRACGLSSQFSDWDVRYIYIHPLDWYLKIDAQKDNYEIILPNDIDLSGWELKRVLRFFRKSNPSILEWLQSPIVYQQKSSIADELKSLIPTYFDPKTCLFHYLNMAKSNCKTYLQTDQVRVKKYFYTIRPILACEWIKEHKTMPPLDFDQLLRAHIGTAGQIPSAVMIEIQKLQTRKLAGEKLAEEPRNPILIDYLEARIEYFTEYVNTLQHVVSPDTEKLDALFRKTLLETNY
jgi:uncharacterized protein